MIYVVDGKNNKLMSVKVEISKNMFIVAPEILNDNLKYLQSRILSIRAKGMIEYLLYCDSDRTKKGAKKLEKEILEDIENMLSAEIHDINETQGIYLYLTKR